MKLKSKLPVFIILATTLMFLGIDKINQNNKPIIKDIYGDRSYLKDVEIIFTEHKVLSNNYKNNKYIINQNDVKIETEINMSPVTFKDEEYKVKYKTDIKKYIDQKYNHANHFIQELESQTIGDTIFTVIESEEQIVSLEYINEDNYHQNKKRLFLVKYNKGSNQDEIIEFAEIKNMHTTDVAFAEGKINIILKDTFKNNKVQILKYDIQDNKIIENEQYELDINENIRIKESFMDENQLYILVEETESGVYWANREFLYVIDKQNKEVKYQGEMIYNTNSMFFDIEKKKVN